MTDNVTPTQVDKDAAASLIEEYYHDYDAGMMLLAKSYRNGHNQGPFVSHFARHRLAAEATQASALIATAEAAATHLKAKMAADAEIARLRGAGLTLLRECERNGVADNVLHGLIPEEKLRDGSGVCEGTKNLRRAMNEFRAALSAQPIDQDGGE